MDKTIMRRIFPDTIWNKQFNALKTIDETKDEIVQARGDIAPVVSKRLGNAKRTTEEERKRLCTDVIAMVDAEAGAMDVFAKPENEDAGIAAAATETKEEEEVV